MQRWITLAMIGLVVVSVTVLSAFASDQDRDWEYRDRRGYSAPAISAVQSRQTVETSKSSWRVTDIQQEWEEEGIEVVAPIHTERGRIASLSIDPQTGAMGGQVPDAI